MNGAPDVTQIASQCEIFQRWLPSYLVRKSIDEDGSYIPWMCYPAVDLLKERVPQGVHVFEYGSGYGTFWWAQRAVRVIAVEHDKSWFEKMEGSYPSNVRVLYRELEYGGEYGKTVMSVSDSSFDVIVVDGRDRVNCMYTCLGAVSPHGVVILDNSDRKAYIPGREFLKKSGFKELRLTGPVPIVGLIIQTSIFYRTNNCLEL